MLLVAHRAPADATRCTVLRDAGADVFEVDLQAIGDEVVVSHFLPVVPLLPRLRHDRWAFRWGSAGAGAERLSVAAQRIPAGSEILLDLKDDTGQRGPALAALILRSDLDPARCYVSSRQWAVLPVLRQAGFRTWRTVWESRGLARVLDGPPTTDDAVTVRHGLLRGDVIHQLRHRAGRVITWTVNSPARAAWLAASGVDGVTSDRVEVFATLRADPPPAAALTPAAQST